MERRGFRPVKRQRSNSDGIELGIMKSGSDNVNKGQYKKKKTVVC